jgi:hypothetical protein
MNDGLYYRAPCPYRLSLPVLGVPTRFESNSLRVMAVVERAFGPWALLRRRRALLASGSVTIRLIVHRIGSSPFGSGRLTYRLPDDEREIVMGADSVGIADVRRREVLAYVAPGLVRDQDCFRYALLEGLAFGLLTRLDRYPLHAAAVIRDGTAYLLAGRSGVGKSTLTYAAVSRGFGLMSDDLVFVQGRPGLRLWGHPAPLRLPRDARRHFRLPGGLRSWSANGRQKLLIPRPRLPVSLAELTATDVVVCLVERGGPRPRLERLAPRDVVAGLQRQLVGGYALFGRHIRPYLKRLARNGGWRLYRGADPLAASRCLDDLAAGIVSG